MSTTTVLALVFAVLLALEWRSGRRSLRVAAAFLAAGVWFFAQPNTHRAARRALALPPAQRVTQIPGGDSLSEYEVGVVTMRQAAIDDAEMGFDARLLGVGVLLWLACSPALGSGRRSRTPEAVPISEERGAGAPAPEA